jgi:hypothetical protein
VRIYQTERKEGPFHAKCEFFWNHNIFFLKSLRKLRRIPNQEIVRKEKRGISLQSGSAVIMMRDRIVAYMKRWHRLHQCERHPWA